MMKIQTMRCIRHCAQNAPKQKQQVIPQTTAILNIKLPILKKEEYDIWAMEMEHYLEYIDNDVLERFQQLLSQLEAHGAEVSNEDANYKVSQVVAPSMVQSGNDYEN
ncbi:hypothetical protein Tco_1369934 [Tanacetum coccineum]